MAPRPHPLLLLKFSMTPLVVSNILISPKRRRTTLTPQLKVLPGEVTIILLLLTQTRFLLGKQTLETTPTRAAPLSLPLFKTDRTLFWPVARPMPPPVIIGLKAPATFCSLTVGVIPRGRRPTVIAFFYWPPC